MRCPMVTEKPIERAADPRRPFLLSSVTAKMQTTSCMVRKTSTVVAIPRLIPGCSWKHTHKKWTSQVVSLLEPNTLTNQISLTVFIAMLPLMLPGVTPYRTAAPATAPRHWATM